MIIGLFRTLVIFFFIYAIYKFIMQIFFPTRNYRQDSFEADRRKKPGETEIRVPRNEQDRKKYKGGEYVDYEEVE